MSSKITIARPYARAAFVVAVKDKAVPVWSQLLNTARLVVEDKRVQTLLKNPRLTAEQKYTWLADICAGAMFTGGQNFFKLLANRHRLDILVEIADLFEIYRIEQEKTLSVQVTAAFPMTVTEQQQLAKALQSLLQRSVVLECNVDQSLLGGIVIRANDLVIDGSVRSKLERLATTLLN